MAARPAPVAVYPTRGRGRATHGLAPMTGNRGERVVAMALVDSTQDNGHDGAGVEDLELIAQS